MRIKRSLMDTLERSGHLTNTNFSLPFGGAGPGKVVYFFPKAFHFTSRVSGGLLPLRPPPACPQRPEWSAGVDHTGGGHPGLLGWPIVPAPRFLSHWSCLNIDRTFSHQPLYVVSLVTPGGTLGSSGELYKVPMPGRISRDSDLSSLVTGIFKAPR